MSNIKKTIESHITEINGKYYVFYGKGNVMLECQTKKAARLVYINGYRKENKL